MVSRNRERQIHFFVNEDLYQRMKVLSWGVKAGVLRTLVGYVVDAVEKYGEEAVIGAIVAGNFTIHIEVEAPYLRGDEEKDEFRET